MREPDEWHALKESYERFLETDLGKLYWEYDMALIDFWRHDLSETISPAAIKAKDERCRETTNRFVAKLMDLAGIE